MKHKTFETKFLSNPALGHYTVTTYYSDGTIETRISPSGPIIIPKYIETRDMFKELNLEPPRSLQWGAADYIMVVFAFLALMVLLS